MKKCFATIILIVFSSCLSREDIDKAKKVDFVKGGLKPELELVISNYILDNQDFQSFLLITDLGGSVIQQEGAKNHMFVLGPLFEKLFEWGEDSFNGCPSFFMIIEGKPIFIQSTFDNLFDADSQIKTYRENSIPVSGNPLKSFLTKAIVIEYGEGRIVVRERPDTIFLKKEVPFNVPPL